jgi:hypothetical protein
MWARLGQRTPRTSRPRTSRRRRRQQPAHLARLTRRGGGGGAGSADSHSRSPGDDPAVLRLTHIGSAALLLFLAALGVRVAAAAVKDITTAKPQRLRVSRRRDTPLKPWTLSRLTRRATLRRRSGSGTQGRDSSLSGCPRVFLGRGLIGRTRSISASNVQRRTLRGATDSPRRSEPKTSAATKATPSGHGTGHRHRTRRRRWNVFRSRPQVSPGS